MISTKIFFIQQKYIVFQNQTYENLPRTSQSSLFQAWLEPGPQWTSYRLLFFSIFPYMLLCTFLQTLFLIICLLCLKKTVLISSSKIIQIAPDSSIINSFNSNISNFLTPILHIFLTPITSVSQERLGLTLVQSIQK